MLTTFINSIITGLSNLILFKKPVRSILFFGLLVASVYLYVNHKPATDTASDNISEPIVKIATAGDINNTSTFSAVGTVESISEAQLKIGTGGQVTAVTTDIGKYVTAGTVLIRIENARESAALLQAQGSYEVAVAGTSQSNSSVRDAEIRLQSAKDALQAIVKNAYSTESSILVSSLDIFFANPDSGIIGLRIPGDNSVINNLRENFRTIIPDWKNSIDKISDENLTTTANTTKSNTELMLQLVDELTKGTANSNNPGLFNGSELSTYTPGLLANRNTLTGIISALQSAEANIQTAEEALNRAQVSATGDKLSISDAQVKIALGSLRAAQANFEKTLVRTPISGVVNALYIKKGDYVNAGQEVAIVANNNGLQVSTYINLEDRDLLTIGDSVTLEGSATGTVTAIAGAVDPKNGKVAVKISIENNSGLTNGTAVKIAFMKKSATTSDSKQLIVPIAAVKLSSEGPLLFTVDAESKLVAKPVTLGDVIGSSVIITGGIDSNTNIVLDVRGLTAGTKVTVAKN